MGKVLEFVGCKRQYQIDEELGKGEELKTLAKTVQKSLLLPKRFHQKGEWEILETICGFIINCLGYCWRILGGICAF